MKLRMLISIIGVLALVALLVAACGGTETTTTSEGGASTTASSETTSSSASTSTSGTTGSSLPDLSGQNLEVAAVWTSGEQANFEKVLAEFEKQTGAQVTFTSTGNDIATILGTRIQGQNPPDVALVPQPGLMRSLAAQNAIFPIDDVVGTQLAANYEPLWIDLGKIDGTQYGFVFKAANKSTFWYSVAALESAGVEPPKTWDDLLAAAQTISDSGLTPLSIGGADGWTLTDWFENVYLQTAGPEMYDKLAAHTIPWTDASVKTALTDLAQIFGKSEWIAGGNNGALQINFPQSVTQVFGTPQKAAMVYEGDFAAGTIVSETEAKLGTDANYVPFPTIGSAPTSVVFGGDTAVLMKDTEGAKALIQFLATPEAADIWVKLGGFTSPNKNVPESSYPDPILAKAAVDMLGAEQARFDMSDQTPAAFGSTPSQGEWKLLQDFLVDPSNIDGIMTQLESAAASAYGQ